MEEVVELKAHLQSPSQVKQTVRETLARYVPVQPHDMLAPEDVGVDFSL